jgi:hypothetical protein
MSVFVRLLTFGFPVATSLSHIDVYLDIHKRSCFLFHRKPTLFGHTTGKTLPNTFVRFRDFITAPVSILCRSQSCDFYGRANFEKTFATHEYGLELGDLEAPLLKADYVFRNPFSNKTLFFSRWKLRLVKMTLDERRPPKCCTKILSRHGCPSFTEGL